MTDVAHPPHDEAAGDSGTRRDFLYLTTAAVGGIGTLIALWPLVDSMNPSAEVLALSTTEVDLSPIAEGQAITVIWQGQPIFIRHRTPKEIEEARSVNLDDLRDPQKDEDRVIKPEYLVMIGVCTHLGCVPKGQNPGDPKGDFDGWLCPCHGSHYDSSGRIRKGPAPANLVIPPYVFLNDTTIQIG